jgi:hypothetical protein
MGETPKVVAHNSCDELLKEALILNLLAKHMSV